jgi:hypothetical protein
MYLRVLAAHPSIRGAAILDDFTMVGSPCDLIEAYPTLKQQAATINLSIEPSKTHFIYLQNHHFPISTKVSQFLVHEGIPLTDTAIPVLGVPIGTEEERLSQLTEMVKEEINQLKILLHEELPIQEAVMLLKMSRNHRLDYLLRCMPPSMTQPSTGKFDKAVIDIFSEKLDLTAQLAIPSTN